VSGETKWQPGPWRVHDDGGSVVTGSGETVALVYAKDGREKRWFWECERNTAALVASAPDLYAALERLRAEAITNPAVVLWPESMRDALTDAVAALARARGEVTP
jgi:hypothetical protein